MNYKFFATKEAAEDCIYHMVGRDAETFQIDHPDKDTWGDWSPWVVVCEDEGILRENGLIF